MDLTREEKETIFTDVLINTFMQNPDLYDKADNNYVYTDGKIKKLKELSDYLKEQFIIIKTSK